MTDPAGKRRVLVRFGTYLDPKTCGANYDHHTFTTMPTTESQAVAVYAFLDEIEGQYPWQEYPDKRLVVEVVDDAE